MTKGQAKEARPRDLDAVIRYMAELGVRDATFHGESFYDHFESNGWRVSGRTPMKDWMATVRNWIRRGNLLKSRDSLINRTPKPEPKPEELPQSRASHEFVQLAALVFRHRGHPDKLAAELAYAYAKSSNRERITSFAREQGEEVYKQFKEMVQ